MPAKQRYLEQANERMRKHPFTSRKIISFSLAMAFLGLSIIFIGVGHALSNAAPWTASIASLAMNIAAIITLQGAVVCSSLSVTSAKYTLHCIGAASLAISLALDIGLAVYYFVIVA